MILRMSSEVPEPRASQMATISDSTVRPVTVRNASLKAGVSFIGGGEPGGSMGGVAINYLTV